MTSMAKRIALVTPWYGRELFGGAERLAWDLSHALGRCGADIEVLTTCARSFADDWGTNYHRAGIAPDEDLVVRRFKVDSRDRVAFGRATNALLSTPRLSLRRDRTPVDGATARWFVEANIRSAPLLAHLEEAGHSYDAVLFVPYLYGTTLLGLPIVADRSYLVPCLHDEAYAYLPAVRNVFAAARGVLFNSEGEGDVAAVLYGPWIHAKSRVIGHAVDPIAPPQEPVRVGSFVPRNARYLLYLGRQDRTKNIDFVCEAFARFRASRRSTALQLVLAGPRAGDRRLQDGVVDLGAVRDNVRAALLTYARAVVQPSVNESFSRTVYEAWYARRPVVVHAECRATAHAVEDSGGGWIGDDLDEWARIFARIDESGDEAIDGIGERGWAAAVDNGTWDVVAQRVLDAVDAFAGVSIPPVPRVDQLVPLGLPVISEYAAGLDRALRAFGVDAAMLIEGTGGQRSGVPVIAHYAGAPASRGDVAVVHGADTLPHEIAPVLFAPSLAVLDAVASTGGIARLLPQAVDPGEWAEVQGSGAWDDGHTNILVVGSYGRLEARRLVETLVAVLATGSDVRLLIEPDGLADDARIALEEDRLELDLRDAIAILGSDRAAKYDALRAAHLAYAPGNSLARDLVMPLWFDVPVLAHDGTAAREIVEPSGLILQTKVPEEIAQVLRLVSNDRPLRAAILAEGRRIRQRYAHATIAATMMEWLNYAGGSSYPDRISGSWDRRA
jgi:glycosyltransferase involved in cell wall biosynthesis